MNESKHNKTSSSSSSVDSTTKDGKEEKTYDEDDNDEENTSEEDENDEEKELITKLFFSNPSQGLSDLFLRNLSIDLCSQSSLMSELERLLL